MNTALTLSATMSSGGTCSAHFDTEKSQIDDELVQEFYKRFPNIVDLWSISLSSKERDKYMLFIQLDFWNARKHNLKKRKQE